MIVVAHPPPQRAGGALDQGLIVALDLPHVGHVEVVALGEARLVAVEQDQLVDAVAVVQDVAEEHVVVPHEVPRVPRRAREHPPDLLRELGRDLLVGVDVEHPVVPKGQLVEAPLLLLRIAPVPAEVDHGRAHLRGDRASPVPAARVDHEDLVEASDRAQALRDVGLLVLGHHDDRGGQPRRPRDHPAHRVLPVAPAGGWIRSTLSGARSRSGSSTAVKVLPETTAPSTLASSSIPTAEWAIWCRSTITSRAATKLPARRSPPYPSMTSTRWPRLSRLPRITAPFTYSKRPISATRPLMVKPR